jgi:hypothetical protein
LFRIEMLFKPKKKKEIIEFIKGMEKNDWQRFKRTY